MGIYSLTTSISHGSEYTGGFNLYELDDDYSDDDTVYSGRVDTSAMDGQACSQTTFRRGQGRTSKKKMRELELRGKALNTASVKRFISHQRKMNRD